MKPAEWKTYRTRFLIKAKQLSSSLSFVDHLGRQHCGRKGDYLVESSDGVLSIAPRRIFEDIYVSMPLTAESACNESSHNEPSPNRLNFAPLEIEEVRPGKPPRSSQPRDHQLIARRDARADVARPDNDNLRDNVRPNEPARVRRKLPQPCRVHPSSSGFRLM